MNLENFKRNVPTRNLILILALFYLLFEIIFVGKVWFFVSQSGQGPLPPAVLGAYAVDWLLVTAYMVLIAVHTRHLLIKKVAWKKIILLHIVFSILISVVIRIVIDIYAVLVGLKTANDITIKNFFTDLIFHVDVNFLIYAAMIFIIYSFYYLELVKSSEAQKNYLETQLLHTRLKMLTTQLQPHFLFNTLNSISSLIDIDKRKAQDTLADLSDFLRQILFHIDTNFITIAKEFQILESYLNILRTRFHNQLKIELDIQPDLLSEEIPTLIMQPIIENAVKHGKSSPSTPLHIRISVSSFNDHIFFKIYNSGNLNTSNGDIFKKGMGLSNLKERLNNIYGSAFNLKIENVPSEEFVLCQLEIPMEKKSGEGKLEKEAVQS